MAKNHTCSSCYERATYVITWTDEDGWDQRDYACDDCVDQYDELAGDYIDSLEY